MEHEKVSASEFNNFFAPGEGTPAVESVEDAVVSEEKPVETAPAAEEAPVSEEPSEN